MHGGGQARFVEEELQHVVAVSSLTLLEGYRIPAPPSKKEVNLCLKISRFYIAVHKNKNSLIVGEQIILDTAGDFASYMNQLGTYVRVFPRLSFYF